MFGTENKVQKSRWQKKRPGTRWAGTRVAGAEPPAWRGLDGLVPPDGRVQLDQLPNRKTVLDSYHLRCVLVVLRYMQLILADLRMHQLFRHNI